MKVLFKAWWQSETEKHSIHLLFDRSIVAFAYLELCGMKFLIFLAVVL